MCDFQTCENCSRARSCNGTLYEGGCGYRLSPDILQRIEDALKSLFIKK